MLHLDMDIAHVLTNQLGSINIGIISSLNIDHINYQYTNSFSYFYFSSLSASPPPQNINIQIANHIYGKNIN